MPYFEIVSVDQIRKSIREHHTFDITREAIHRLAALKGYHKVHSGPKEGYRKPFTFVCYQYMYLLRQIDAEVRAKNAEKEKNKQKKSTKHVPRRKGESDISRELLNQDDVAYNGTEEVDDSVIRESIRRSINDFIRERK